MSERANRAEVRNPILGLEEFKALQAQPEEDRRRQAALYYGLAARCRDNATKDLGRNKPWMFVYWRCIGVYARHTARALMRGIAGVTA